MRDLIIKQFNIKTLNPKSEELIEELTEKIKNISFFKLQNCKFCTNKLCLMLKKECLFYDRITGQNYQFFKCKYFKRAYIRADNDQVLKSYENMLSHLFLKPDFDKSRAKFSTDGTTIYFEIQDLPETKKSFSLDSDSYNNIIFKIKDLLIDSFGYINKDDKFKIIQLNKYEIKFELNDEIFIYRVLDKYNEFINLCKKRF